MQRPVLRQERIHRFGREFSHSCTFWQADMRLTLERRFGEGGEVIGTLVKRAKKPGFTYLRVADIYGHNAVSRRMFESVGFKMAAGTEKGHSFERIL